MMKKAIKYYLIATLLIFSYYFLREVVEMEILKHPIAFNGIFIIALLLLVPFLIQLGKAISVYLKEN